MTLSEYTTEELKRLTTFDWKAGEYVRLRENMPDVAVMFAQDRQGEWHGVSEHGAIRPWSNYVGINPRRVRSFTDLSPMDPPHAEMLAELTRRERPVVSNAKHAGRLVVKPSAGVVLDEDDAKYFRRGWHPSDGVVYFDTTCSRINVSSPCRVELL